MLNKEFRALTQRVRDVLKDGSKLAIIGWMDSNHSKFTRSISHKMVAFYDSTPDVLSEKIGYAIFTKFVGHPDFVRIKRAYGKRVHSVVVQVGHIKAVLVSCESLLCAQLQNHPDDSVGASTAIQSVSMDPPPNEIPEEILTFAIKHMEVQKMNEMDYFILAFMNARHESKNGLVGSRTLGMLIKAAYREHGIKLTVPELVSGKWIEPEKKAGKKKIGWYKAGAQMVEVSRHEKFESKDPIERAKAYIARESDFLAEQADLETRLTAIKEKLEKVAFLRSNFDQIEKTIKELN